MGDDHGGIDKVASSWTLHGWSPLWTLAVITLPRLESPSTWMYDSTTFRYHDKNLRVSKLRLHTPIPSLYILASCMLYFSLLIYSLHSCLICIVIVKLVPKLHFNLKKLKNCNFSCLVSNHPPSRHLFSILSIGIRALVSIALV